MRFPRCSGNAWPCQLWRSGVVHSISLALAAVALGPESGPQAAEKSWRGAGVEGLGFGFQDARV